MTRVFKAVFTVLAGVLLSAFPVASAAQTCSGFSFPGSGFWSTNQDSDYTYFAFSGDFNGDKKSDLIYHRCDFDPYPVTLPCGRADLWDVCLSNPTSNNFACTSQSAHAGGTLNNFLGDFDGNGMTDLAAYAGSGSWTICLSLGATGPLGFQCTVWAGHAGGPSNNIKGDFNGDGRTDIAGYGGGTTWRVCLSLGVNFSCSDWAGHAGGSGNNLTGDFDGNGMTDIAAYGGGTVWRVCLSQATMFSCSDWTGHAGSMSNNTVADFNGDGRADIAAYEGNSRWVVCTSNAIPTNFTCRHNLFGHGGGTGNNITADFNGDGRSDLAAYANNNQWNICLARLDNLSFACSLWQGHGGGIASNVLGDYNGDRRMDLAGFISNSPYPGNYHVTLSCGGYALP